MSEAIKNHGKSIRSRLLNIAKSKGVFYQTILTRYFQERLLYRMSQTSYKRNFYLKGGALMYAFEQFAARPTLDIDFLGLNISNDGEHLIKVFQEICAVPCEEDGVVYHVRVSSNSSYVKGTSVMPVNWFSIASRWSISRGANDS